MQGKLAYNLRSVVLSSNYVVRNIDFERIFVKFALQS